MVGLGQRGLCEGGGNYVKYLKFGWNRREGTKKKKFKKGRQAGSRGAYLYELWFVKGYLHYKTIFGNKVALNV